MIESYLLDKRRLLPASAYLAGQYGVRDRFIGVPVVIGAGGVERIIEIHLTKTERGRFDESVASVDQLIEACRRLDPSLA
jgi:malate dehydrogenase